MRGEEFLKDGLAKVPSSMDNLIINGGLNKRTTWMIMDSLLTMVRYKFLDFNIDHMKNVH